MKRFLFYILLMSCFIVSCHDDDASKPSCPEGYSGKGCNLPFNSVFTGNWTVEDLCSSSEESDYAITLLPSAEEPRAFVMTGMWDEPTASIVVHIRENNKLKFSESTQPLGNSGFTIEILEGEINKAGDHMSIEYIIYSGPVQVESCSASCILEN